MRRAPAPPAPAHATVCSGDIVLVAGSDLLARAIRYFTRSRNEPETRVTHAGIVHDGGPIGGATVIEALARGVVERPLWSAYAGRRDVAVAIYRIAGLTGEQRRNVRRAARGFLNRKYGYHALFAYALTRHLITTPIYPVCSLVVAHAYEEGASVRFGTPARNATPDEIDDWCVSRSAAVMVHPLIPLAEGWAPR